MTHFYAIVKNFLSFNDPFIIFQKQIRPLHFPALILAPAFSFTAGVTGINAVTFSTIYKHQ